jgi:superfamily II DNA or RNA helicase
MLSIRNCEKNEKHKKKNTIRVESNYASFTGFPTYVKNYRVRGDRILIPRVYAYERLNWVPKTKEFKCMSNLSVFSGQPREYQQSIINDTLIKLKEFPGVILSVYTGSGKTFMALKLLTVFKLKTIIIVNKEMLMDQWIEQIKVFIPNARVGKIQGTKFDTESKDIVIGMLQTVSKNKRTISDYKQFNFVIYDECHNVNAKQFSDALFLIPSYYRLGLSATPTRSDGLHVISESHIGPIITYENEDRLEPEIHIYNCPAISINHSTMKNGKVNISKITTDVSVNDTVNNFIAGIVKKYHNIGHKILVLTSRVQQCKLLSSMHDISPSSVIAGKMTSSEKAEALKSDIIFSTYQMFSEGTDKPNLSCLILAASKVDITQAIGRVLRRRNEHNPVVCDILYTDGVLMSQWYRRNRQYKMYKKIKCSLHDTDT